jgi:GNAT superfamily N-acetyltransferase
MVDLVAVDPIPLEFVVGNLPAGFGALEEEALAEGHRHVERLAADWMSGILRFDREGEALAVSRKNGILAGIGGVTIDPVLAGALRMWRLYVRPSFRRAGIGRELVTTLLGEAARFDRPVTVNAAPGSVGFWQALGFEPDRVDGHTHRYVRSDIG